MGVLHFTTSRCCHLTRLQSYLLSRTGISEFTFCKRIYVEKKKNRKGKQQSYLSSHLDQPNSELDLNWSTLVALIVEWISYDPQSTLVVVPLEVAITSVLYTLVLPSCKTCHHTASLHLGFFSFCANFYFVFIFFLN